MHAHHLVVSNGTPDVSRSTPVLIGAGSNLGDRQWNLARALDRLGRIMRVVRVSSVYETAPLNCPPGSPFFLNLVIAGLAFISPHDLLERMLEVEWAMGRRRGLPNAPRPIDLDLIFFGSARMKDERLELPHPRFREREFVLSPIRELALPWIDPLSQRPIGEMKGTGAVRKLGPIGENRP